MIGGDQLSKPLFPTLQPNQCTIDLNILKLKNFQTSSMVYIKCKNQIKSNFEIESPKVRTTRSQ